MLISLDTARELHNQAPDFCAAHRGELKDLEKEHQAIETVKQGFGFGTPDEREAFLGWFEKWLLRRAEPAKVEA